MSDTEYLPTDREAELLATILIGIDGSGSGEHPRAGTSEAATADRILCDLIEMGLAHQDAGPAMFQHWTSITPDAFTDDDDLRAELVAVYVEAEGLAT